MLLYQLQQNQEKKKRSETEKITKENDLTRIETLYNKLKQEKKRIKELLK